MDKIKELLDQGLSAIIESGKVNGALYNSFLSVYTLQFPERKSPAGCSGCMEDAFYSLQKFYNKQLNPMETTQTKISSAFHIKGNGVIYSSSLNKHISNDNLTDDLAFALLEKSENYEKSFDLMPKDWKEKLAAWQKEREAKRNAKNNGSLGSKSKVDTDEKTSVDAEVKSDAQGNQKSKK